MRRYLLAAVLIIVYLATTRIWYHDTWRKAGRRMDTLALINAIYERDTRGEVPPLTNDQLLKLNRLALDKYPSEKEVLTILNQSQGGLQ